MGLLRNLTELWLRKYRNIRIEIGLSNFVQAESKLSVYSMKHTEDNHIKGTIPTELGLLENLNFLFLGESSTGTYLMVHFVIVSFLANAC